MNQLLQAISDYNSSYEERDIIVPFPKSYSIDKVTDIEDESITQRLRREYKENHVEKKTVGGGSS
jgi:hypothetical protein